MKKIQLLLRVGIWTLLVGPIACSDSGDGLTIGELPQGTDSPQEVLVTPQPQVILPEEVLLEASKSYGPSQWQDDVYDLGEEGLSNVDLQLILPEEVAVLSGNSGNHWVTLIIDEGEGSELRCKYRGGADVSKPLRSGNQSQIEKGQRYRFESCDDKSLSGGDPVSVASALRLTVNNGDSTETTTVIAVLDVLDP